jgi:hypothetical protein
MIDPRFIVAAVLVGVVLVLVLARVVWAFKPSDEETDHELQAALLSESDMRLE